VFVDCDPKTYNIEPTGIMSKISDKTKAVIAVHLYGQPADLGSIRRIADEHKLRIVQDCAQAHGATIGGKPLADYGDILCFSYYPGKNLGAYGDAGAIVTNDTDPAEYCARFADHGRTSKYNHEFEGTNSRLDGIQGAILDVKLKYLDSWTEKRRALARTYDSLLKDVPDVITPPAVAGHGHVYHLYVVRVGERDALRKHLKEHGISTGVHYPVALPNLEAYAYLGHRKEDFAIASKYQDEILSLPLYPELTLEMVEYVVEKVRQFYRNRTEQF
jgi:dTDP-4-amino-4,6-dideoxygalactose transaminase